MLGLAFGVSSVERSGLTLSGVLHTALKGGVWRRRMGQNPQMIEEHDTLIIRCSQLGGEVPFRYCRTVNEDLPCRRIILCWEFRIEVAKFLNEHYSIDQIQRALAPPTKTRLETILELIEKAKKIKEE
jgi:hypothetical protein